MLRAHVYVRRSVLVPRPRCAHHSALAAARALPLSRAQTALTEFPDGVQVVVAGPGSGKMHVAAARTITWPLKRSLRGSRTAAAC